MGVRRIIFIMARTKKIRGKPKSRLAVNDYQFEDWKRGSKEEKRFCSICRFTGNRQVCCNSPTMLLPYTAHVPRKNASKSRWEEFYTAYPELRKIK